MKDDSKSLKLDYSSTIYQLYYKKQTTNSIEPTDFKSKKNNDWKQFYYRMNYSMDNYQIAIQKYLVSYSYRNANFL